MQAFIYAFFVFCVWYADSSDLPLEELVNKDVSSVDSVLSSLDNDEVSLLGNSAVNSQGKFDLHGSWKKLFPLHSVWWISKWNIYSKDIKAESIRKVSNFNFQWTKTLY